MYQPLQNSKKSREFVRRYLLSDNIMQLLIHRGRVQILLEDEQTTKCGGVC
jgi:hypothetical protein